MSLVSSAAVLPGRRLASAPRTVNAAREAGVDTRRVDGAGPDVVPKPGGELVHTASEPRLVHNPAPFLPVSGGPAAVAGLLAGDHIASAHGGAR